MTIFPPNKSEMSICVCVFTPEYDENIIFYKTVNTRVHVFMYMSSMCVQLFTVCEETGLKLYVGPVPARYVRQSQMCPQLDMSDKNERKTQDMSDKARCVRQNLQKIARYVRQICQTKMKTKCTICLTGHNYNI